MKLIKNFNFNHLLGIISLFCFCIILTDIFPCIRLPYSLLDKNETCSFNKICVSLAISCLSALFVYYLTVIKKNHNERKKRKGELDKLLTEFNRTFETLELETDRVDTLTEDILKKCNDKIVISFINDYTKVLDKAFLYKDIMTEKENDTIAEMRRIISGIINPPSLMDKDELKICIQSLQEIRYNVDKFKISIDKLTRRHNPKMCYQSKSH